MCGVRNVLGTKPWAQSTSQATNMWKSSHVPQSVGFLMWFLGLKLQHKCRHPQDSFTPRQLWPQGAQPQLCGTGMETQRHPSERAGISSMTLRGAPNTDMGSPPFSKAEAWLLQLKGSRTAVIPSKADPAILPKLVENQRTLEVCEEPGNGLPWSHTGHGKTFPVRIWLLFQPKFLE